MTENEGVDIVALAVAAVCALIVTIGFQFVRSPRERGIMLRLFLAAFALRVLFTLFCNMTGIINLLGGGDDLVWKVMWAQSRNWEVSGPQTIWSLMEGRTIRSNPGYRYLGTLFYYYLNVRSQMSVAFINCALNALTVVMIYRVIRDCTSEKAALLMARIAMVLPSFLVWSALTVKETWLILFEISTFYFVWKASRLRNLPENFWYWTLALTCVAFALLFRFYAMTWRSLHPLRSAGLGVIGALALLTFANAVGLANFDLAGVTQARLTELQNFREAISSEGRTGVESAIILPYDTSTVAGALMQILVGACYLLLSPFPWQINNIRMLLTLPDLLVWWWLVFMYIIPGIRYAWGKHQQVVISIVAFVGPLIIFYSLLFANVGLAFRQRAQLLPFLLIFAAYGYHYRREKAAQQQTGGTSTPQPDSRSPARTPIAPAPTPSAPNAPAPVAPAPVATGLGRMTSESPQP
jgi:hypothetical protein